MKNTYSNLMQLADLYDGNRDETNEALREAVEQYKQFQSPEVFSFVYCRVFKVAVNVAKKFSYMPDQDKASISTEVLHEAMESYTIDSKQSVQYYFSICYNNRLLNETRAEQTVKRKANEQAENYEEAVSVIEGKEDEGMVVVNLLETLKTFGLSKTEMTYCKEVLVNNCEVKNVDVAEKLKVSSAAITDMKRRLRSKFENNEFYKIL